MTDESELPPDNTEEPVDLVGHTSLPIRVPSLEGISNQEIKALRDKLQATIRKARKEANKALCHDPTVKALWLDTLSPNKTQNETLAPFETELLRHPDAFIAHAWANAVVALEQALREEMFRRGGTIQNKKRR